MVNRYYQFEDGGNPYSVRPRGANIYNQIGYQPINSQLSPAPQTGTIPSMPEKQSTPIQYSPPPWFTGPPEEWVPHPGYGNNQIFDALPPLPHFSMDPSSAFEPPSDRAFLPRTPTQAQIAAGETPSAAANWFTGDWQSRLWEPGRAYGSSAPPIFRASDIVFNPEQSSEFWSEAGPTVTTTPASWGLRSAPGIMNREYFLMDLFAPGQTPQALGSLMPPAVPSSQMMTESGYIDVSPDIFAEEQKRYQDWFNLSKAIQEQGPAGFLFGLKTGGQHGQIFGYTPVTGPDGQTYYVPTQDFGIHGGSGSTFDTNSANREFNRAMLTMAALIAGGAFLPSLFSGGAAAGAEAGLSAADAAALASGWEGAVAGAAAENAALAGSAGGLLGGGLPASLGGVEGVIAGSTTPANLSAGLGTGFAGTTPITGTLPSITPGAITGSTLAGTIPSMIPPDGGGSPWLEYPGHETIPPPSGGNMSWTDFLNRFGQIFDNFTGERSQSTGGGNQMGLSSLLSALYGVYARDKYGDLIKGQVDRMQQMADPYLQKLRESYENPQAYLQSPEMQAVLNLEANRLAGIDASRGRLSNDFERTAKLQQLAQARLNDYRRGLQGAISSVYTPQSIAEMFKEAAKAESSRYGDLAAWVGAGGSVQQTWGDIVSWINAGKDLWDLFSSWWDD